MGPVDLKNLDGEPATVAQASIAEALRKHRSYTDSLVEAERYVRNAAMTEFLTANPLASESEISDAWVSSWESRILVMLRTKAASHGGVLEKLRELVEHYEGYGD